MTESSPRPRTVRILSTPRPVRSLKQPAVRDSPSPHFIHRKSVSSENPTAWFVLKRHHSEATEYPQTRLVRSYSMQVTR